ncbi:MAG TPA: tRNA pseudouridine(38-40) synthase TruA [Candidatus Saccharimonadales bacterium]|nr:tRNA pseudouridine(38-40) synthase TruA [Candidatus Saccharimonadales bacterium]
MTYYKIVVAYDGTGYHGWQAQPGATTISQVLIDSFSSVFFQKISVLGASRTDAGVHALGQVAIVRSPIDVDVYNLKKAWSKAIPGEIVIKNIQKLDRLIHPHDGVVQKTYAYYFFLERPLPFVQRFGWYYRRKVDLDLLQSALTIFVGTHNFRSFCSGDDLQDTVRTIDSVDVSFVPSWNAYRIEIKGKSFLRYMVRRIVGACLEIASRDGLSLNDLQDILSKQNPCHTLPNAPSKGLVLEQILYETEGELHEK